MARTVVLGGVPVRDTTAAAVVRLVARRVRGDRQLAVGFVNHHFVVACRSLRAAAAADPAGLLLLNDGVGVALAARLVGARGFRENLNGTDLVPRLLREVAGDLDVFLLGGAPEVVARAAAQIGAMPRRRVVGAVDGYSMWTREAEVIAQIAAARPDLLLVGLGNPRQERWILDNRRRVEAGTILAVGALFEWMTGSRQRAPWLLQRAKLEWVWRLALEPRRLARRYTLDIVTFFIIVWREREANRGRALPR